MIHLIDVAKSYKTTRRSRVILEPTTLTIPTGRRVAILGLDGSGKTTILNMLAGRQRPDHGRIVNTASLSPPFSSISLLSGRITARDNALFAARLYEREPAQVLAFTQALTGYDDDIMDQRVDDLPTTNRRKLVAGIVLALNFECYIADDHLEFGDHHFRERLRMILTDLYRDAGLIIASGDPEMVRPYCEMGLVIYDRCLVPFEDINEAISFFNSLREAS